MWQKLSKAQLRTAMERMGPDGDGEVTFPEFEAWWIAFGDEARERPRVPKCELLWSTCGFGMCATACGYRARERLLAIVEEHGVVGPG